MLSVFDLFPKEIQICVLLCISWKLSLCKYVYYAWCVFKYWFPNMSIPVYTSIWSYLQINLLTCHWLWYRLQSEGPEMACQRCAAQCSCNTSRGPSEFSPLQRCHQQLWEVDSMGACSLGDFGARRFCFMNDWPGMMILKSMLNSCFGWTPTISEIG